MANKHFDDYDLAFEETERKLAQLENRIYRVYKEASEDMAAKTNQYFDYLEVRDKEMRELVMSGGMTEQHYRLWREAQIGRGERMAQLRDDLARRAVNADAVAMAYVRDETPGIYSLNYNYTAYTIEQVHGNIGFTLYDEQTVRRLLQDDPEILPMPELDEEYDFTWNRTKMQDAITSGILQGESFGKIATRLQHVANMDRTAALRNARTALTTAQNAGRQASIERATRMGIYLRKRWIAVKDGRTRHSHGKADGQIREVDEYFDIGSGHMMYPGDVRGPAKEVYNCRCSMRTVEKDGIEAEPRKMRVVDPESGETMLVNEMTYQEWKHWKQNQTMASQAEEDDEALKFFSVDARDKLNKIVKRSTIKIRNGFACFPDNDPLNGYAKNVEPQKTYYDVAMHGTPDSVAFGSDEPNMSPRVLASVIRHSEGYSGQNIRLLSCSTGQQVDDDYCFAEELANALGVNVKAPNKELYISEDGKLRVGRHNDGKFITYKPNERRRMK